MPPSEAVQLRRLVAEIVREVTTAVAQAAPPARSPAEVPMPGVAVETVRVSTTAELQAFAARLLAAYENPDCREDLRTGRLKFALETATALSSTPARPAPLSVMRVERGAVTERMVVDAAAASCSLVLCRAAVITPLARERAKALNVRIQKESA
ncbi:MAG: hypothetical protein JWR52_3475 [Marmoricola sp.]|nr:hypothetical protein [Marmoricola sp.]